MRKPKDQTTILRTAEFLKKQGWSVFDVKHDSANGHDLTIEKKGVTYRVEVKKAIVRDKNICTEPVGSSGIKCEAIAILLPNDSVLLQPMNDHLSLCSKTGLRAITHLVRLNI